MYKLAAAVPPMGKTLFLDILLYMLRDRKDQHNITIVLMGNMIINFHYTVAVPLPLRIRVMQEGTHMEKSYIFYFWRFDCKTLEYKKHCIDISRVTLLDTI